MAKRCVQCILPETIPHINFNDRGVCNYCLSFEKSDRHSDFNFEEMRDRFNAYVDKAKKYSADHKSKYDILVPVSGGRDSSYLAWTLATEYKLRVLCVNYANPYTSGQAVQNVQNLVKTINAGLVTFKYRARQHERSFESNLRAWIKKPDLSSLGLICLACKPMYLEFYRIAHTNKVSLIIDGSNVFEVTTFKMEAQGGKGTKKLLSGRTLTRYLNKIVKNLSYIKTCNFLPALKTIISLNGLTPYLRFRYPDIYKIGFFYFFPYKEDMINEALRKIGWKKAEDNLSPWRFDCEIDSLKNYIYERIIGATEKDDCFSKYIRYGLMTRAKALERLNEGAVNPAIVERIIRPIGISLTTLDRACKAAKSAIEEQKQ